MNTPSSERTGLAGQIEVIQPLQNVSEFRPCILQISNGVSSGQYPLKLFLQNDFRRQNL
jgi:hypothetical protein